MKRYILIWLFLCSLFFFTQRSLAGSVLSPYNQERVSIDSILDKVMLYAPFYEKIVGDYTADLYIKGRMNVKTKNQIIRFVPSMFKMRKNVREYIMESYSELHFSFPSIYDQKIKACIGTVDGWKGVSGEILDYFHVNIYSSTLLSRKLLSPLAPNGRKYYNYQLDSTLVHSGNVSYRIKFTPKSLSYQLVSGYMIVSSDVWSVRVLYFSGRSEYRFFNNFIKMGDVGTEDEFLPVSYDVNTKFRFLGNVIEGNYLASLHYKSIEFRQVQHSKPEKKYDLTQSYTLQCDTNMFHVDAHYFEKLRPVDLSEREKLLYKEYDLRKDTIKLKIPYETKSNVFFGQAEDALMSDYSIHLARLGNIKCSPVINPLLLSYNHNDGVSYKQEFKYNRLFSGDRLLHIVPKFGYNFKRKELYWAVSSDFDYWPRKRAAFHVSLGNGNRIYSSDVLDELKEIPDSLFDFNKVHLDYFRDLYLNFSHSLEVTNGLTFSLGFSAHKRTAIHPSDLTPIDSVIPGMSDKFRSTYISFAPRIKVEWTPGQYYYMNGARKVNLHSDYPTFSVDWERGIKGVFNSSGHYERIELDIQHQLPIGLMRSIYWRFGCGGFTNQEQLYFVDFANFSKNNLPIGWNDDIGGVFQLLDGRWYNSSRKYVRGNFTYEAPFLILPHIVKYTRNVLNERLYASVLVVPHLKPYLEVGYGIGTHIFDFGVFVSNVNGQFSQVGCKFTFELFNR
ncbi:DUF5686 family protein [uncultured Bacteroides sp.]|uniref:DUF5686 family protein n=1 Tax=uncultured Bacteroides sp. TaxID=162156 RepID=UPI002AA66A50|nr:DUF5686 family protein [uncultured Bacteroides sp.]